MNERAQICATSDGPNPAALYVVRLLSTSRLPLDDEKILQAEMADLFDSCGIKYEREKHLGDKDILDFLIEGGIGVEVKIKGSRLAIFRQVSRYCMHDEVKALVLATNVPMALPRDQKPLFVAQLGTGWL